MWDIRIFHGEYIRRLIENRMPRRSCDSARGDIFEAVVSMTEEIVKKGELKAVNGVRSIRAYLKKAISVKCINYCRDYDPETGLKILHEYFGKKRDKIKKKKKAIHMDREEALKAFKGLGINFQKEVLHKRVFLLHIEGMARTEIAKTTRLSVSQVKKALETTMQKLRKHPLALFSLEISIKKHRKVRAWKMTKEQAWKAIVKELTTGIDSTTSRKESAEIKTGLDQQN